MKALMGHRRGMSWAGLAILYITMGVGIVPACAATPPDGRGYELVSPSDKGGGDVMGASDKTRAAPNGNAVGFASLHAFGDALGTGIAADYIAVRTGQPGTNGWTAHAITPRQQPQPWTLALSGHSPLYTGEFSDDLSTGIFRSLSPVTDAPNVASTRNLYLRRDLLVPGPGTYQLLSDAVSPIPPLNIAPNASSYRPGFAGASKDFSHVLFESRLNLTADAVGTTNRPKLYEWVDGALRLAGILPDGSVAMCNGTDTCAVAGQGASDRNYTTGVISEDGSRVFFATPVASGGVVDASSQLYMRDDHGTPDTADDSTVQLNASERSPADPPGSAKFWAATPNGEAVVLSSDERLTDDDTLPGDTNLYVYDTSLPASDPHNLRLVSVDGDPSDGASVIGVLGIDDDASTIYFLAAGRLLADQPAVAADGYIYRWHSGGLQYVGALHESNLSDFELAMGIRYNPNGLKSSRVSNDGRFLLFTATSGDGLTGYVHGTGCGTPQFALTGSEACTEVYLYDAQGNGGSGRLICASCREAGALEGASANVEFRIGGGGSGVTTHLNRPLSHDGRRLFFTTDEPLTPGDRNGKAPDVYEYDTGSGTLALVSSGRGEGSYFLDASANGNDVFFITRDQLVGWDTDQSYDLYDARVGGGFPEPPKPVAPCAGDACQGELGTVPSSEVPSSATFREHVRPAARLRLLPLSHKQVKVWAATGHVLLRVRTSVTGTVHVRVIARIGGRAGHVVAVASTRTVGRRTGTMSLTLAPSAQRQLRRVGSLRLTVIGSFRGRQLSQRMTVTLRRGGGR